ncbi:MAG: 16S rRNA (guanine(527)-N(7))-methyltransferase RsmG [Actinomycetota bacterium]
MSDMEKIGIGADAYAGTGGIALGTGVAWREERERAREAIVKVASRMGVEVLPERIDASLCYMEELLRWNKAFNLVGRKQGFEGLLTLFLDSITPLLFRNLFGETTEVVDIGSGAGMPGIPLYILGGPFALTLVESQRKKVTFLRHVSHMMGLSGVAVFPGRLEGMQGVDDYLSRFDVGVARAVMQPPRLLRAARPLISEGGVLVLFVGKNDAEALRKSASELESRGWRLEGLRSTQRYVGRENYLALVRKTSLPLETTGGKGMTGNPGKQAGPGGRTRLSSRPEKGQGGIA